MKLSIHSTIKQLPVIVFAFACILLMPLMGWAQLFQQDFGSSTTVSDYVNASSPNNTQFNSIGTSGAGTVLSINTTGGNKLRFARTGNAGTFARTTDFSPIPSSMMYRFDVTVSGNSSAQTTAAVWQVGSGFGTTNSAEANANVHSRLGLNWTTTSGQFSIRDISAGTNSSNYTGTQTITWVINNSGTSISYVAPDASMETVADDRVDVWIGTTKEFNDVTVLTSTQTLSDLKFAFTAGSASVDIDNILINPIPAVPTSNTASDLAPTSFRANWSTVTGVTGYRIDVATDAGFTSMVLGWSNVYVSGQSSSSVVVNTGLSANTTYFYRVRGASQYTVGEFAGGNSSSQSLTTPVGCTPPATQTTLFTSNTITTTTANISITRGNGNSVLIIGRDGTAVTTNPSSGTSYTASQTFGSGDAIGSGRVVYNNSGAGTNTSTGNIALSNLASGTTYHFAAYEYATTGTCYNTTSPATGSLTTICVAPTTNTPVTVGSKSFTATWSAVTGASSYSLDYSTVSDLSSDVTTLNSITGTSQVITGLNYNTQYYFRVRAINTASVASANSNISSVTTLTAATGLVLVGVPGTGFENSFVSTFTVEARRANSTVDDAYTATISIAKVSGTGTVGGTLAVPANNGIATFNEVSFDVAGTYTIYATDGNFTSATSGNIVVSVPVNATAVVWSGTGSSAAWLSTGNWTGGIVPTATQVAQFASVTSSGNTVGINMNTLGGATSVGGLEFTSARANPMTLGNNSGAGGILTLNGVVMNSVVNVIIKNNSSQLLTIQNNVSGSNTMGVALGNTTDNKIVIDGTGGVTISSVISGSNKLTKQGGGSGILQLTGANTYTGLTTVLAGTLQLNRSGGTTIPVTNNISITGGTLKVSSDQTLNNLLLNGGTLTVDAGITLTINGIFTFTSGSFSGSGSIVY